MSVGPLRIIFKDKSNLLWFVLLIFSIYFTFNRHRHQNRFNYHSEIWADRAGYYVYLPLTYIYQFDGEQFPQNIAKKTGNGFAIEEQKVKTKYTCGVAILQTPFFLIAHYLSSFLGFDNDGFSLIYHYLSNIGAAFYCILGLFFLDRTLRRYVSDQNARRTSVIIFLATNLIFYGIFHTLMSHVYSFFLFSIYLYLAPYALADQASKKAIILVGLSAGMIVVTRQLNLIFLPVILFLNPINWSAIEIQLKKLPLLIVAAFVPIGLQMSYWKYAFGSWIVYSYDHETFSNYLHPETIKFLFSTINGLFVFTPIMGIILIACVKKYTFSTQPFIGYFIGLYFLIITYIFSSWYDWSYGCSYSTRVYCEYFTLFAIPLALLLQAVSKTGKYYILIGLCSILCVINVKFVASYDDCWYGGLWDFKEYFRILMDSPK
jgi:hypothetical protein